MLMAMAGYAFAKFDFRGKPWMFFLVLATMMIPVQVTMIPTYLILNGMKLTQHPGRYRAADARERVQHLPVPAVHDDDSDRDARGGAARRRGGVPHLLADRAADVEADPRGAGRAHIHRRLEQLPLAAHHRERPEAVHAVGRPSPAQPAARGEPVAADGGRLRHGRADTHRVRHLPALCHPGLRALRS